MSNKAAMKIITYGLRYSDFDTQRELFALRNNGVIDIVGEIAYIPEDDEIFFKRMSMEDGAKCSADAVIVCGGTIEAAKEVLCKCGYENIRIEIVSVLTGPERERFMKNRLDVLKSLVDASDSEIHDREWLRGKLFDYGFFPFFKLAKEPQSGVSWSTLGILQVPDEFVEFCLWLSEQRVDTAIEIGVAGGSSSYIMAAILSRNNKNLVYHMVDICDALEDFEQVSELIPALKKDIPMTSDDFANMEFDFCFIDADHSYDGMMNDWKNVGQFAGKYTVFHDIFGHEYDHLNGGTVRGWQKIKESVGTEKIREISSYYDRWMGIGIVENDGTPHK